MDTGGKKGIGISSQGRSWLLWIGGILIANIMLSGFLLRWDLTAEKRYSLTPLSEEVARSLNYPLEVTAYMEGTYPLEISRFQQAVYNTLLELDTYSRGLIELNYIDPSESQAARDSLRKYGFAPIGVRVQSSATETSQKAMYPILYFQYGDRYRWVNILKNYAIPQRRGNREVVSFDLEKAEANLEYEIVSALQGLLRDQPPTIAFLTGQGELSWEEIAIDIQQELSSNYIFGELDLGQLQGQGIDNRYLDAIIIQQPTQPFSEREKYELDQYLMRGGNLFWILDYQRVDFDMSRKENALTLLYELNLDDFFFQQGLKLNPDLILDLNSQKREFARESESGSQFESLPWVLYPLVTRFPNAPVTRNVESALIRNGSSIDILESSPVQVQPFLISSPQARRLESTSFLDLNYLLAAPSEPQVFNEGPFLNGVLIEGNLQSLFAGRKVPSDSLTQAAPVIPFQASGTLGKMALIADGEFLLGEDFRGQRRFSPPDNRTLFFNVLDYMMGNEGLSQIRAKEVVLRPLDKQKIEENALALRLMNIFLPVILLLLLGMVIGYVRRRRARKLREQNG